MRKFVYPLILALFFSFIPAFAAPDNISKETEKILSIVKERIEDTADFENFSSSSYENNGNTLYSFDWNTRDDGKNESLYIECNKDGIITNYNYFNSDDESYKTKPSINKISIEKAKENAEELIKKLNPTVADKLLITPYNEDGDLYSNQYTFNIIRTENNIPIKGETGFLTLNSNADKITSFNLRYTSGLTFDKKDKIISKEDAQKLYGEKLGLELCYLSAFDDKNIKIIPCYTEKDTNSGKYINALTGEIFEEKNNIYGFREEATADKNMMALGSTSNSAINLSDAEISELETLKGLLSKEDIINLLKTNKYLSLPNGFELSSYRVSKDYYSDNYISRLYYEKTKNNNFYGSLNFSVDSKTGEIKSFNYYDSETDKSTVKIKTSKNASYSYLNDAAKILAKDKFSEYKEDEYTYPDTNDNNFYSQITYIRYINDIPYKNDRISVRQNLKTGKIEQYNINYTDEDFPEITNAISIYDAQNNVFENIPYDLYYIINDKNACLVYAFDDKKEIIIDANKNLFLNYALEEYTSKKEDYTDIEGHYAEEAICELKKYCIFLSGEKFEPDTNIKQKEYLFYLTSVFSRNGKISPLAGIDEIYNIAKQNKIITDEEINPEAEITRCDAAKYLVRAMGYEEISSLDIYSAKFSDVKENKGAINILYGLGIIKGNGNGLFYPQNFITRAETAVIIHNYLLK